MKIIKILFIALLLAILFVAHFKFLLLGAEFDFSPDSKSYMSAAEHLLRREGLFITSHYGLKVPKMPYLDWPPLYPILIAIFEFFLKLGLPNITRLISTAFLVATIFPIFRIINKLTQNYFFSIIASILIVFSLPFIEISRHAWTETPYMFLSNMALFYMLDFKKDFIFGTFFVLLACLTRWTGFLLVFLGIILILFQRADSLSKKIHALLFFVVVTCLPVFLWCLRSILITGNLGYVFGEKAFRNPLIFGLNFFLTCKIIFRDIFRLELPIRNFLNYMSLVNSTKLFLSFFGLFYLLIFCFKKIFLFRIYPIILYIFLYFIFIISIPSIICLNAIETRYTVPMYHSICLFYFMLTYKDLLFQVK